jgi:hypothetical protein
MGKVYNTLKHHRALDGRVALVCYMCTSLDDPPELRRAETTSLSLSGLGRGDSNLNWAMDGLNKTPSESSRVQDATLSDSIQPRPSLSSRGVLWLRDQIC